MQALFEWLQNLPFPMWIVGTDSIWTFPFVLFLHSMGMGMCAGLAFIINMRLLGVGSPLPVSSLRVLFTWFWAGFFLSLVSGTILFMSDATHIGNAPIYYAKLLCLACALTTMTPLRTFIFSNRSNADIPTRISWTAAASLALWLAVLATGRLIAYQVDSRRTSTHIEIPTRMASLK